MRLATLPRSEHNPVDLACAPEAPRAVPRQQAERPRKAVDRGNSIGQRYDAIAASDPDYLQWIVEKSELEEGIKHSARYWLGVDASGDENA